MRGGFDKRNIPAAVAGVGESADEGSADADGYAE
jgi:hypothetical protein